MMQSPTFENQNPNNHHYTPGPRAVLQPLLIAVHQSSSLKYSIPPDQDNITLICNIQIRKPTGNTL